MHGKQSTKKAHHTRTGSRRHFCPERVSAKAWRSISKRNLVDTTYRCSRNYMGNCSVSRISEKSLGMKGAYDMKKRRRSMAHTQGRVRVVPVLREEPDIPKLGRAVIKLAAKLANEKVVDNENEYKP